MSRKRIHRSTVSVDVTADVEIEDVLAEMDDEDIRREAEARGILLTPGTEADAEDIRRLLDDLRDAFDARDRTHFDVMLVRLSDAAGVPRLTIPSAKEARA